VRAVCVSTLVRTCAEAISEDSPYRGPILDGPILYWQGSIACSNADEGRVRPPPGRRATLAAAAIAGKRSRPPPRPAVALALAPARHIHLRQLRPAAPAFRHRAGRNQLAIFIITDQSRRSQVTRRHIWLQPPHRRAHPTSAASQTHLTLLRTQFEKTDFLERETITAAYNQTLSAEAAAHLQEVVLSTQQVARAWRTRLGLC
jgi:hypothetical protein